MLKTSRGDKERLNVRWNIKETTTTTTPTTNNNETKLQQQANLPTPLPPPLTSIGIPAREQNKLKVKTHDEDEEKAAQTALDKAHAALEAAKAAIDAMHAPRGKYVNWNSKHAELAAQAWCCIGDVMAFCDKYEFKSISRTDARLQSTIVSQVKALLNGQPPFSMRLRFPANIRNPENLWICIGHCAGIEYHLNRILNVFRKPLEQLSSDKQRLARQNFHLAINELRLDMTARILELRLYDCSIFERDFKLNWANDSDGDELDDKVDNDDKAKKDDK